MGGFFKEGQWFTDEQWEKDGDGHFNRRPTTFREQVHDAPDARFRPEADRYHLYVSYACPWAHRVLLMRAFKGLEHALPTTAVTPLMRDDGWTFDVDGDEPDCAPDPLFGAAFLREVYLKADPAFTGRVTVPVLWDRREGTIVNNESRELIRMLDREFNRLARREIDLCPADLEADIDAAITAIYEPINNGVYRCGFAGTFEAYSSAFDTLFEALDHWEGVLGKQRYMVGDRLTEADLCMFTTLLRFDPVYYVHFKCNQQHIYDYPNLSGYLREIYQMPGVAETCNMDHIKRHYYSSHLQLNPTGFVPKGPRLELSAPHGRDHLPARPLQG